MNSKYYYYCEDKNLILPKNITDLTFGWYFNQPIDNLPDTLTDLTFGCCFNQHVIHCKKIEIII
jgi:hypothetical protein